MITSFNPENKVQFEMYTRLFDEAYADLAAKGIVPEGGHFASLDEYFAHISDLRGCDLKYLMIPLDEATEGIFSINANDRTVSIPAQFNKCGAVQGDEMCEIAVFTVDRYFDFQDLDMVDICIQWINADKKEGISEIQIKDAKTFPGKLRFGWPLTSTITEKEGPVQFAVRFFVKDAEGKMSYILNTLPATLNVKKGLDIVNPDITEQNVADLFASFVKNSQNPSYEIPKNPFFVAPGQDITPSNTSATGFGAIDSNNKLTFTAQAVANDLHTISYVWKYKNGELLEDGSEKIIDLTDKSNYTINEPVIALENTEANPIVRDGCQKYWYGTSLESLSLYTGNDFPAKNEEGEDLTYYIKKSTLTIEPSEDIITGKYFVEATNTAYFNGKEVNSSQSVPSSEIIVPAPQTIIIKDENNLPEHIFIENKEDGVKLAVIPEADANGPAVSYKWYKSGIEVEDAASLAITNNLIKEDKREWVTKEIGWYTVVIESSLNRTKRTTDEENNDLRKLCKVTYLPEAPVADKFSYCYFSSGADEADILARLESTEGWTIIADSEDEDEALDKIPEVFVVGDIALLKVETNLDNADKLASEELEYIWMVQEPGASSARLLTEDDINANGLVRQNTELGKKTLAVRCLVDGAAYNYYCIIKNHIQDKSAELDTSKIYTFTIA